jgi:N-acetylglucosaminyldiphosphoundecaprenol N-acetyl-beta-D-mannosaminyltransferase
MPVDAVTVAEATERVVAALAAGSGGSVITPNLDILRQYRRSADVRRVFEETELIVADGMPVVWALRIQGTPVPERVTGSDMVAALTSAAERQGASLLLCGGPPGTAARAADYLRSIHPRLRADAVACQNGPEQPLAAQLDTLADALVAAAPDIAYLGVPFAGHVALTTRLRQQLPATWFVGVGSTFEFLNGDRRRAPVWLQRLGLEWAHRLVLQPRLWRRYLVDGLPFAASLGARVIATRARKAVVRGG